MQASYRTLERNKSDSRGEEGGKEIETVREEPPVQ